MSEMLKPRYSQIRKMDLSDGPGVRIAIYTQGCIGCCPECFNKETWDPHKGEEWTEETNNIILDMLKPDYVAGLSILGGDPFYHYMEREPSDYDPLMDLCTHIKMNTNKTIWIWSGYHVEDLIKNERANDLLHYIDVLVDGPFIKEQADIRLQYRGSRNQRVINFHDDYEFLYRIGFR